MPSTALGPRHGLTCTVIALAAVAARLPFLLRASRFFDADEAVEGLMARHLGDHSFFFWGQRYKGTPEVFVNAVNGADGLFIDKTNDNVWICANQADEIVVIDKTGKAIAKLGDFNKLTADGAPNGLLFPASLARSGDSIYITNLSLDLRLFGLAQSGDSQWAAQVTRHTISRIPARIP